MVVTAAAATAGVEAAAAAAAAEEAAVAAAAVAAVTAARGALKPMVPSGPLGARIAMTFLPSRFRPFSLEIRRSGRLQELEKERTGGKKCKGVLFSFGRQRCIFIMTICVHFLVTDWLLQGITFWRDIFLIKKD